MTQRVGQMELRINQQPENQEVESRRIRPSKVEAGPGSSSKSSCSLWSVVADMLAIQRGGHNRGEVTDFRRSVVRIAFYCFRSVYTKRQNENKSGESGEKHSSESGERKHSGESQQASFESSSNETSASGERHHGNKHHGGKRHHCRAHRHHKRNNASSESNETSGERHQEKPQCRKTKEQHKCMKEEMQKLAKDAAFVDVINTLIHQKQKCKQIITWSCSPKCEKKRKCIFQATKPCREAFMNKMKTCLAAKGFTLPPHMMKEHNHMMFTTPVPDVTPQN